MYCPKHPNYRAVRAPATDCLQCGRLHRFVRDGQLPQSSIDNVRNELRVRAGRC